MQTSPISSPALLPGNAPSASSGADQGGPGFDQVLSREVAGRDQAQAARGDADKSNQNTTKTEGGARSASTEAGKDTAAADKSASDADKTAGKDDAAEAAAASAEMLALVASINQLQNGGEAGDAGLDGDESALGLDAAAGKRGRSPFAAIHAALGGRANHGTQSRPEGTWAAQVDRAVGTRVEAGRGDAALPVQGAADDAAALAKAGSAALEFNAAMKEAAAGAQPLQAQAALQTAQLAQQAQATAETHLAPRVGTPDWDGALGQKVVWMVNGEQQNASLTLNPPELGPLKVVLQVTNAQANATFVAAQPEVRQALEAAMPRLRDMLEQAGIQLGHASVDSGSPQERHPAERQMMGTAGGAGSKDGGETIVTGTSTAVRPSSGVGLVDTFV